MCPSCVSPWLNDPQDAGDWGENDIRIRLQTDTPLPHLTRVISGNAGPPFHTVETSEPGETERMKEMQQDLPPPLLMLPAPSIVSWCQWMDVFTSIMAGNCHTLCFAATDFFCHNRSDPSRSEIRVRDGKRRKKQDQHPQHGAKKEVRRGSVASCG